MSLKMTSVRAVYEDGVIRLETQVISDPAALEKLDGVFERVGLEAGPLFQCLEPLRREAAFDVIGDCRRSWQLADPVLGGGRLHGALS